MVKVKMPSFGDDVLVGYEPDNLTYAGAVTVNCLAFTAQQARDLALYLQIAADKLDDSKILLPK